MGSSRIAPWDPDTQEVIPEGTASLADWIQAIARCVDSMERALLIEHAPSTVGHFR